MAWVLPLILAIASTGYLAWGAWVSARDPAWLYRGQEWWRTWLKPSHDAAPVVVIVSWLVTAALYWWPRRRHPQQVGLAIVAAMVVIGAVLATASLAPCRGGQSHTAVVAWIISLYVGALEPRYGPGTTCPGQLPLALQLGRSVCLGATLVGALSVAAVLWRQPVSQLRATLVKDAMVLTGLDAMTLPLLRCLTSGGHESRVVVIEPDQRHPLLDEARGTGAQILIADPASARVLAPILKGLRGSQLRYLYSLRPDAAENEAVLRAAKLILGHSRVNPEKPPHLVARIDDPRHANVWRGRHISSASVWLEDALSPQETTASALVSEIIRTSPRQVLLCGDSTLALAVLLELAHRVWEQQWLVDSAIKGRAASAAAAAEDGTVQSAVNPCSIPHVVILDRRASDLAREFKATSPETIIGALPDLEAHSEGWHDGLLAFLDAMDREQAAQTAVVIADTASQADLHEAGRVARLHPDTSVFVLASEGGGITGTVFDKLQPFQRALLVDGEPPDDAWTRIARHWHESFRLQHPTAPDAGNEPTRRPWAELDEFIRQDNVLQLRSIMSAVVMQGRHWVPSHTAAIGSFVELTDAEIERVAQLEHLRWYQRRRKAGWRVPATGERDNYVARVNRNVQPWPYLPQATRETIQFGIRSQLATLEAVGFIPVLPTTGPPTAREFRRIGEVRAERLVAGQSWIGAAGCRLTGADGDWKVIDDAGSERTIRDQEFRATHEPLDGNRWCRTGTVRAWLVSETTVLRTIEGKAVARPGDWIVQGPRGERWPVAGQQFVRSYRSA